MANLPTYSDATNLKPINQVNNEWGQLSGIVASIQNVGLLWAHNDGATTSTGGSAPEFCPINRGGTVKGRYTTHNATLGAGWEDCALGPGPDASKSYLYFGSYLARGGGATVNNGAVLRVEEPTGLTEGMAYQGTSASVDISATNNPVKLRFAFGDNQGHTSECLLCDPLTGDLFIVCKGLQANTNETGKVFKFAYPQAESGTTTIPLVADLDFGPDNTYVLACTNDPGQTPPRSQVTAGDVSPDGEWIVIRARGEDAWVWRRDPTKPLEDAWGTGAASNRQGAGGQHIIVGQGQEAICFSAYNHVSGGGNDGWPGGIYGTAESGGSLWFNVETAQPDADSGGGGGSSQNASWKVGIPITH